jgi:transposase
VRLRLAVRRFVCPQSDCPRRIFAERLPGFTAPWARTTDRLRRTQTDIGSSLGGEAGSRLAARMAIITSPDTLLRRIKRLQSEPAGPPRVVGIDDWAWRKGQRYGTIVVDLERSDVIDLPPIVTRIPWRRGSRSIPRSRWSAGTVRGPMPRRRRKVPPKPSRSRTAGIC